MSRGGLCESAMLIDPYELARYLGLQITQRLRKRALRCGVPLRKVSRMKWAWLTEEEAERIIWDTRRGQGMNKRPNAKRTLTGRWAQNDRQR